VAMARDAKVYTNQGIIAVMQDRERRFVKKDVDREDDISHSKSY